VKRATHFPLSIQQTAAGARLLDPVRKQLVPDMPEERVRQEVLWTLVHDYGYPAASLASEELVARGTANRDRADILIRLPKARIRLPGRSKTPSGEPHVEPAYSAKLADLKPVLDVLGGEATLQHVDDELVVEIDGVPVRCRTLGFVVAPGAGHGLALEAIDPPAGLPPIIGFQVSGYGMTDRDRALAQRLGIPENPWEYDASTDFAAMLAVGAESWLPAIEAHAFSADGTRGTFLMTTESSAFAVLVHCDPSKADAPGEGGPEDDAEAPAQEPNDGSALDVVWGASELAALAVVECKAPSVFITPSVIGQAERYADQLGSPFVVVTNGGCTQVFQREPNRSHVEIPDLPTYDESTRGEHHVEALRPEPPVPPLPVDIDARPDCLELHRRYRSEVVGSSSSASVAVLALKLDDALRGANRPALTSFEKHGIRLIEDLGVNDRDPGSPVGASWPGRYRDLLIEDSTGHRFVVGLAVLGSCKTTDRSRASGYWMRGGETYLVAASSDGAEYESTLQLQLAKSLGVSEEEWRLGHDGALTAGKGGVKRETLFSALRSTTPFLVGQGIVDLGSVPRRGPIEAEALQDLTARLASYCLVRRTVKQQVKAARRLAANR
jgi:hypothetical protein